MRASRWRDPLAAGARADDPLLGRGRNAQDPYRGLVSDEGKVEIPIDLRNFGHWLTGLFGDAARIAGADPTLATCTGTIKLRFDGATLMADAAGGDPVTLSYALTMAEGWALGLDLYGRAVPKCSCPSPRTRSPAVTHPNARDRGQLRRTRRLRRRQRHHNPRHPRQRRGELRMMATADLAKPETGAMRHQETL